MAKATHKQVIEYIKSQYLACKQEWLDWSDDAKDNPNPTLRDMARRFANEAYAQSKILEVMAHDLYDINLYDWYLEQL